MTMTPNPRPGNLALLLLGLLAGCAGTSTPSQPSAYDRQTGDYRELLLEQDGWRVWRLVSNYRITCFAVKPAPGRDWPMLDQELALPSGGMGFYAVARPDWPRPHMGFYGQHPYDRLSRAELDGATIEDVDDRDRVLGWEGRRVAFRVSTLPTPGMVDEAFRQFGELDFTGVSAALQQLDACRAQRGATLERNFNYGSGDDD